MIQICRKCGKSFKQLAILAMMMDCGAIVIPSPLDCEHDFENIDNMTESEYKKGE